MAAVGSEEQLGAVARLQVQVAPLKQRDHGARFYDPSHIVVVDAIRFDPDGAVGLRAGYDDVVDVHNANHPRSRDVRGDRAVSVMADADYRWLRAHYGCHMTDGVAGETIMLAGGPSLRGRDLRAGLRIETGDGVLELTHVRAATPCVEFTCHVLQRPRGSPVDATVRATLEVLDHGTRGFVAGIIGEAVVRPGDRVFLG